MLSSPKVRILVLVAVAIMAFKMTQHHLEMIRDYPHLLGHMIGKDKLTELHSQWIYEVWDTKEHSALMGHRGSYKTTGIDEVGSIWWLLFHPNDRIAIVRKPYTEAAKTVATIKQYMQMDVVRHLFEYAHGKVPKILRKKESSLLFSFKKTVTKEGSIDAYGIDGNMTGNHYDKILCDDIITLKDRISKAERERTKQGVFEILSNIIDPGKQAMFVGSPWHKNDAWTVCPTPKRYDIDATRILSADEIAEKRRTTTPTLFAINYNLKFEADENSVFDNPQYVPWAWKSKKVYAHIDAKYSGNHTAALTIMTEFEGRIHGIGFSFTENAIDKIEFILQKYEKYRAVRIAVEENPDKGYVADLLRAKKMVVDSYHESMNKDVKIATYLKKEWPRIVWDPETEDTYMEQITDYREGQEPNDAPDSAASLIRKYFYSAQSDKSLYEM